jgi:hypothetical protein
MDPRKPVIPIAIEDDEDHVLLRYDGAVRSAPKIVLSTDDVGRMRAGYVCAKCWEPHAVSFPKQCSVCKFPMAEMQSEYLAKAYKGSERIGPSTSLSDELAALDEVEARQKREKQGVSVPQIIVPRSL